MKIQLRWACLILILISSLTWMNSSPAEPLYGQAQSNTPFEIRGIFSFNNQYEFSVTDTSTGASDWITVDRPFYGLRIRSYESSSRYVTASYEGKIVYLKLVDALTSPRSKNHVDKPIGSTTNASTIKPHEIPGLVEEYRVSQLNALPEVPEKLYEVLKKSAMNRVKNYEAELLQLVEKPNHSPKENFTASSFPKTTPGSLRKKNRVNSRPWASDHIEAHGLPD